MKENKYALICTDSSPVDAIVGRLSRQIVFLFSILLSIVLNGCGPSGPEVNNETVKEVSVDQTLLNALTNDTTASKMVWIPGGKFQMGTESPEFPDAKPVHEVRVNGFWMDEHEVTNAEFARFIKATGYKTIAERPLDPADYPNVPKENLMNLLYRFAMKMRSLMLNGQENDCLQKLNGNMQQGPEKKIRSIIGAMN